MLDCELLREVYINLLDVKEPKFNLTSKSYEQNIVNNNNYNKSIINITDSEIKMHKEFLKKELKKFLLNFFIAKFLEVNVLTYFDIFKA